MIVLNYDPPDVFRNTNWRSEWISNGGRNQVDNFTPSLAASMLHSFIDALSRTSRALNNE